MCQVHTGSKTRPRCSVTFSLMTNIRSGSNNHYFPLSSNYSSLFSPVEVFTVWFWLLRRDLKNKQTGDTPWKWKSECCLFHWEKNEMRNNGYTARVCVCVCLAVKSELETSTPRLNHSWTTSAELCADWNWMNRRSGSKYYSRLTEHLPEIHCGEQFSENTQRRKRNAHDFGTTGGAMFPRRCLFKYSKSCQVSELDGCLRYSLSCLRVLPELSPGFP